MSEGYYWVRDFGLDGRWHVAVGKNPDTNCGIPVTNEHLQTMQERHDGSAPVCPDCARNERT